MSKRIKLPGRAESAEIGGIVAGASEILDDSRGKTQNVVNDEVEAAIVALSEGKQDNLNFDNTPTEDSTNPVTSGGVYAAEKILSDAIEAILLLIPSAASALNKLVDMSTLNSSIATATASFKGTYNLVSDLHLTVSATHAQIAAALDGMSLGADNNDYAFVQVPNTDLAPTEIKKTERYKFNGTNWAFEYDLNNSGFTSAQWAAINSGITSVLVSKLNALPTNDALVEALAGKQDNLTFDTTPTSGSTNPVTSGGIFARNAEIVALINALDEAKQNVLTFDTTPTDGSTNPVTSNGVYQAIYLVQVALAGLDGRVSSTEHSITVLTEDVGVLRTLYQALSQSDIIVGTLPATGVANMIYRVPGTSSFADWMYYGGSWVKLAEYTTLDGYLYKGIATPTGSPAASVDKMFYFAMQTGIYTNFGNLVVTPGVTILKYDGANWTKDQLNYTEGVFDISAYNLTNGQPTAYADLAAALGTNGANVPVAIRRGGMSIKFVQSSDHKYIRYNLVVDEFTTDVTKWAIDDVGVYVENPEFIYVKTDAEDKILWAIKTDGTIYYGAGVPPQVIDYINEKIAELSLDEYEDIVAFLDDLEKGDKNLQDLLDEKVDKEEGKSLIDAEYANGVRYIENPEFIEAQLDKENRLIWGIQANGNMVFGSGVPQQIKDALIKKVDKEIGKGLIDAEYANGVRYIENPEFVYVLTDSEGKIILAVQKDCNVLFGAGVPQQVKDYIEEKLAGFSPDGYEDIVAFLDDLENEDKTLRQLLNERGFYVENEEFIEVLLDAEGKIIEATKADGAKYFGAGIELNSCTLGSQQIKGYSEVFIDGKYRILASVLDDGTIIVPKFYNEQIASKFTGLNKRISNTDIKIGTIKKISIIGDSISTFNAPGFKVKGYQYYYPKADPNNRCDDVRSVEQTWWKRVINDLNAIIDVNASYSGSTASSLHVGFSQRVPILGNPDVVFVALGTNDSALEVPIGTIDYDAVSYDLTKFAPAYIKGIKDIMELYPNAQIVCVAFDMGIDYQNTIQSIAEHYGFTYIYVGDISDVHPNKAEMMAVAYRVSGILNRGNTSAYISNLPLSDGTTVQSGQAYIDSENGNLKVKL